MLAPCKMLIATTNSGKVREIRLALAGLDVEVADLLTSEVDAPGSPQRWGVIAVPAETGVTFAENALLKANYYAGRTGMLTVAEDSGLAIDALGGRPSVESARYPGETYPEKFRNLYLELAGRARPWTARYVCSVAVVDGRLKAQGEGLNNPDSPLASSLLPLAFTAEATVEGEIAEAPQGANGFGYDPIFFYPQFGTTLGNVDDARKLAVSHRGKAFAKLRDWLTRGMGEWVNG